MKSTKLIVLFILIVSLFSENNEKLFQNFSLKNDCIQKITGKMVNQLSNENIDKVRVTLYSNGERIESMITNQNGEYSFNIKCNTNYQLIANKLNFNTRMLELSTSKVSGEIIVHDFLLGPECIQTISGSVLNKNTEKPLSSEIVLYINNVETERIKINDDGKFYVKFQCKTNYKIVARKVNYKSDSYNFLTNYVENNQPDYYNIKKDLYLEPIECFQTVIGKILEKGTNKIIPYSTVSLSYQNKEIKTFQTSFDGSYFFNIKCGLNYHLKAYKDDRISDTISYGSSSIKGDHIIQNIFLEKEECYKVINGLVINKISKLPLKYAQLTLYNENEVLNNTISDSKGTFSFNLKCGVNYKIRVEKNKYQPTSISFITDENSTIALKKTIELKPLKCDQIVNGTVYDKNTNLTLSNTLISLIEGTRQINNIITDNDGNFSFKINCEGNYKLIANNAEYNVASSNFSTNSINKTINNVTFNLIKKLCNQTVTGVIRDKVTKKPLPNTTISLYQNNKIIDNYLVGIDGVYKFNLKCSSSYQLTVFKNNSLKAVNLKTISKHNQSLTLHIDIDPLICNQYINGLVKENITNNPIKNTKVLLLNNSKEIKQTITDSDGRFNFEIDCEKRYTLVTEKMNFTKVQHTIVSTNKNAFSYNVELILEPIIQFKDKYGIKYIETEPIIFELNEYEISKDIEKELNKVVFNMNQNLDINLEVNCHTDSRGPDKYNLQLTIDRANAAKDYLVSKGIDQNRIKTNGFGETKLLNTCKNNVKCTDAQHVLNKRIEFIVIQK
jgi:outer membrane protein OmpA-like peptidoglycan-associated protein